MEMLRFKPLLKQTLWGGEKIIPFKNLDADLHNVGESWEISGVPGKETIVSGGEYDGWSLNALVEHLKEELVGKRCYATYGNEFPLLIKLIDARKDLSIQVHPSDEIAKKQGFPRGKTEMWYVMESDADAHLYSGLKRNITPEEYKALVDSDTICDALQQYAVSEGNVFFLPAGRIHAIGAGCFLAEIQQTSDVTWRIYDFKRRDADGNYRELHTRQAAESIDYTVYDDYRTHYVTQVGTRQEVVTCPYFHTSVCDVDGELVLDNSTLDSFVILIGVKGEGSITDDDGQTVVVTPGTTVLVPASTKKLTVEGTLRLIETHL